MWLASLEITFTRKTSIKKRSNKNECDDSLETAFIL